MSHPTLEIPPAETRPLRWRRAWRSLRALLREPEDTDRAVDFFYAIGQAEFERNFQRFAADPRGRALLVERPRLLGALGDRGALARMPEGSFGCAYLRYLEQTGFAPDGLIRVQERVQRQWEAHEGAPPLDPLRAWYRDRMLLCHDLDHVLSGYGTDHVGEAALLAFGLAHRPGLAGTLLTLGAALDVWRALGSRWLGDALRAWRRARRSVALNRLPVEALLPLPVETVRRIAGLASAEESHPGGVPRGNLDAARRIVPA